ncbi:MAG: ParA family protein [Magnetococcales bacterium]|nr:ParA family protein [Magnetococcales bacterium]
MYAIAIYNNKGGVGKSTLTVFMADFLASLTVRGRPMRVVVLDLDPQGSCGAALLGQETLTRARASGATLGRLARELDLGRKAVDPDPFLFTRQKSVTQGRAKPVAELTVMISDKTSAFAFEVNPLHRLTTLRERLRPELEKRFDIALLDLPGNIDPRNLLAVNGLIMSDSVITPVEVSRFSIDAMPDTVEMIRYARQQGDGQRPLFLGMLLNRTDKRGQQYQRNIPWIHEMAGRLEIPLFEQVLPNAQSLTAATDDALSTGSLRERYGSYYPQVKAVVGEAFRRWQTLEASQAANTG